MPSRTNSPALDRPLRIAVIAHLRHSIKAPFMGGMEAHADLLVRQLERAGHAPTLFASGDSGADLPLQPVLDRGYQHDLPWEDWHGTVELASLLRGAYGRAWAAIVRGGFDVVHNNTLSPDLHAWARSGRIPMVTTLHVPPFEALSEAARAEAAPWHRLTVPSDDQARHWKARGCEQLTVVRNGIDLSHWRYNAAGGARAVWFGRITPNKGTAEALRAATIAGIGLDVAGPIDDAAYFDGLRGLWGDSHRYLGHLAGAELADVVGGAAVAVCTPLWDEPFGLVAAEALACGTPVAALARGALPEVIGDCGVVAADVGELAASIRGAAAISRDACRRRAEKCFGAAAMVSAFEPVYAAAIAAVSSEASTRAELA